MKWWEPLSVVRVELFDRLRNKPELGRISLLILKNDLLVVFLVHKYNAVKRSPFIHVCRVDVHRKENVGSLEKAITIYGNPENCTNACRRVLEVMQQEADNTNKG